MATSPEESGEDSIRLLLDEAFDLGVEWGMCMSTYIPEGVEDRIRESRADLARRAGVLGTGQGFPLPPAQVE